MFLYGIILHSEIIKQPKLGHFWDLIEGFCQVDVLEGWILFRLCNTVWVLVIGNFVLMKHIIKFPGSLTTFSSNYASIIFLCCSTFDHSAVSFRIVLIWPWSIGLKHQSLGQDNGYVQTVSHCDILGIPNTFLVFNCIESLFFCYL